MNSHNHGRNGPPLWLAGGILTVLVALATFAVRNEYRTQGLAASRPQTSEWDRNQDSREGRRFSGNASHSSGGELSAMQIRRLPPVATNQPVDFDGRSSANIDDLGDAFVAARQPPSVPAADTPAAEATTSPPPLPIPPAKPQVAPSGSHTIGREGAPSAGDLKVLNHAGMISLMARDVPLQDVVTEIAQTQGLNLVMASPTAARITLRLREVRLEDTLNAILAPAGFSWNIRGNIVYVTNVGDGSKLPAAVQARVIRIFELDYVTAADVDLTVKGLLSPIGQSFPMNSTVTDNRKTREVLAVEDTPDSLRRIEDYIMRLDQPPRQVMIEVHILQVDLQDDLRHGVNFEHLAKIASTNLSIRSQGFANPNAPQAFLVELSGGNLTGLLEALKTTADAKTLASPRILAVNGQESRIQIGEQLGFRVTTTTETSTLESVDFLDVGVVVTVTPRITKDNRVLMRIRPEVSSGQVNPETGLPEEETTELQTDVFLRDGQGMVIGGLIQERDTNTHNPKSRCWAI